jgi:hypothetical protein
VNEVGSVMKNEVELLVSDKGDFEKFFLISCISTTDIIEDIKKVYSGVLTGEYLALACERFGSQPSSHEYAMIVDSNMTIFTVYNKLFASYDKTSRKIIYKGLKELLD